MKYLKMLCLCSALVLPGCINTPGARTVSDVHKDLCDAFVLEEAKKYGIPVSEAVSLGWNVACMLNVGKALDEVEAQAGARRSPE